MEVVVPPAPDGSEVSGADLQTGVGDRARSAGFRLVLLIVLVVVSLAAAGFLGVQVARDGGGTVSQAQRDEVMSVARRFMLAINSYGPALLDDKGQMPQYRSDVTALITPKFQASFDQSVTIAEQTAKAGLTRTADVFATGVADLDQDSATVLVAGSFTNSYKNKRGKVVDDEPAPFRVAVSVVKIDGKWIVDDFTPVTGVGDDGSGGTGGGTTPSTPATDGASPSAPASSQGSGQ